MQANDTPAHAVQIYRPDPRWYLFAAACALFGVVTAGIMLWLPISVGLNDIASSSICVIGALILLDLGAAVALAIVRTELILSSEGIIFHGIGYGVRTSWENVQQFGEIWAGNRLQQGLLLRDSGLEVSPWLQTLIGIQPALRVAAILGGRYIRSSSLKGYDQLIPVTFFDPDWKNGAIGATVRHEAPWVFDLATTPPAPAAASPAPADVVAAANLPLRRAVIGGIAIAEVALAIGLVILLIGEGPQRTIALGDDTVNALAFAPDGQTLIGGTYGGINLWRVSDGTQIRTITAAGAVDTVAVARDNQTIATGTSNDGTVSLSSARDGALLRTLRGPTKAIETVAFAPDGQTLASGGDDGVIWLWRVSDGEQLRKFVSGGTVNSLAFSPDGKTLAAALSGGANAVQVWSVDDGSKLSAIQPVGYAYAVAFSPDGTTLAAGMLDHTVTLWSTSSGTRIGILSGSSDAISRLVFTPDGRSIAAGAYNGVVYIWRVSDGALLHRLRQKGQVFSLAVSPDGHILATAGTYDHAVQLYGLAEK